MREWTDEQFRDAGWLYVLRRDGMAVACTVCPTDAQTWEDDGLGEVTILGQKKVTKQTYHLKEGE